MQALLRALALVGAVALVATISSSATADPRAGYAVDDGVVVTVSGGTLIGGDVIAVSVTASRTVDGERVPVVCDVLRVSTAPGLVEEFIGGGQSTFDLRLTTQVVPERTPTVVTAVCEYAPLPGSDTPGTASASNRIVLLPVGGAGDDTSSGILPRTGAETGLWLLALGAILVAGGGGVTLAARRRRS